MGDNNSGLPRSGKSNNFSRSGNFVKGQGKSKFTSSVYVRKLINKSTVVFHGLFNNYSTSARWIRGDNHLISNKREWNNCFIKSNPEILLNLANFALKEQPEDNLMVTISRTWYNGSYTTAAKPIKSLELHYNDPVFNKRV